MEDLTFQILTFSFLVLLAVVVVLTCIWKIVNLIALYKMETTIEELGQLSEDAEEGTRREVIVSPKEARRLRRLSILAGVDPKWCNIKKFDDPRRSKQMGFKATLRSRLASMLQANGHSEQNGSDFQMLTTRPHIPNGQAIAVQSDHKTTSFSTPCPHHKGASPPQSPKLLTSCAIHGCRTTVYTNPGLVHKSPMIHRPKSPNSSSWSTSEPEEEEEEDEDTPIATPPSPPWLHCSNPRHWHYQPPHVHRCHCGASFPNLPAVGVVRQEEGPLRGAKWNRCGHGSRRSSSRYG